MYDPDFKTLHFIAIIYPLNCFILLYIFCRGLNYGKERKSFVCSGRGSNE